MGKNNKKIGAALAAAAFAKKGNLRSWWSMGDGEKAEHNRINTIRKNGILRAGISGQVPGFSQKGPDGNYTGIDIDYVKALALVILGDSTKVEFIELTSKERFDALKNGTVDVLARNTTWTHERDSNKELTFVGVNFYDGQGFMTKEDLGVKSARELSGASIAVIDGTTTQLNLKTYFKEQRMEYTEVLVKDNNELMEALAEGKADVITADSSALAGLRLKNQDISLSILPEIISKEPLGPVVNHGDEIFADLARWVLNVMIEAEEKGITSLNIDTKSDPTSAKLLGQDEKFGDKLDLPNTWAYDIIKEIGNYGEIFERNLIESRIIKERSINELWTKGGILYVPPLR
ncbi:Bacterial extracellular solute-binding proteins, family 3 [seawater metagenome]|uniref:Bacterial extracellular solute-binding proteins, family 3 n=1 Tax=seawater metagenome TaxID=1561972 RepID=A0A5E8CM37_9ZZZZ